MSMTSYRNSESPWESYFFNGIFESANQIVRHNRYLNHLTAKNVYKNIVYYACYYCENADPIWETARRGILFQ